MNIPQEFIEFLNLNPIDQVRYSLHYMKCRMLTFIYRSGFWASIFLSRIKLDKAGFYVLIYSGALKNMFDVGLVTVNMLDSVLVKAVSYTHLTLPTIYSV